MASGALALLRAGALALPRAGGALAGPAAGAAGRRALRGPAPGLRLLRLQVRAPATPPPEARGGLGDAPARAAWGSGAAPPRPFPARPPPTPSPGPPPNDVMAFRPRYCKPVRAPTSASSDVMALRARPSTVSDGPRSPRLGGSAPARPASPPSTGGGDAGARGGAEGVPESRTRGLEALRGSTARSRPSPAASPRPEAGPPPTPAPRPPGHRREPRPTPRSLRKRPAGGGQGQGTSSHGGGPSRRPRGGVLAAPGWRVTPRIWAPPGDRSDGWNRAPSGRPRAARRGTALPARTHAPLYAPSL